MATSGTRQQTQAAEQREDAGQASAQPLQTSSEPQRGAQPDARQSAPHGGGEQPGGWQTLNAEQLARGLGWFSIGLGLAEVFAPRGIARLAGVQGNTTLIRLFGLREIASGIAIFTQGRRPAAAVWSRVAGDALDLMSLGVAFVSRDAKKGRVAFATANVLAVTALDVLCARQLGGEGDTNAGV